MPAAASCSRWSKNCARFSRFLIDSEGLSALGPSQAASTWLPGAASAQADGDAAGAGASAGVAEGLWGVLCVMIPVNERKATMGSRLFSLLLLACLGAAPARADSWAMPQVREVFSAYAKEVGAILSEALRLTRSEAKRA